MVDCHQMKNGQVYACSCGLELKVIKECTDHCTDNACEDDACPDCTFECCGKPMALKQ